MTNKIIDTKEIQAFDVWTFLSEVQKAIQAGYVLSDKNEHFPYMVIGQLAVTLVKYEEAEEPVPEPVEEVVEIKEPTKEQVERAEFEAGVEDQAGQALKPPKRGRIAKAG
jgi:hypothetical protein